MNDRGSHPSATNRSLVALIVMTVLVLVVAVLAAVYLYGVVPMMFPTPS